MASMGEATRREGAATILAIGTALPTYCHKQSEFPDFLFRSTKSEHKTQLKEKFKRICEKSGIKKRYTFLTEEVLEAHPNLYNEDPSYDTRQDITIPEVPKLGKEAALKAIKEWGQPISKITHLVFSTSSGIDMPGADYHLTKLLNLNPSIKRYMIYQQGCFSGAAVIRLAKDLAENNAGARVLVVSSELLSIMFFHGPSEADLDHLVGNGIFGDGAAALIIGAYPDTTIEHPIFQIESASQMIVPGSEGILGGNLTEMGATYYIKSNVPSLVGSNIEANLNEAFSSIGISDWDSLFYVVHPGGPAILNQVKDNLGLKDHKLRASHHVLTEYGNMGGPGVIFALDQTRKKSIEEGKATTGGGLEWGVLVGLGPGITMETIVLRSFPIVTIS